MSNVNEITATMVEDAFDYSSEKRFTCLCNAVVASKALSASVGYPALTEKPGPDGSIDCEWTIPAGSESASGFGRPGWNVLQYKARGIKGRTRKAVLGELKRSLKGAAFEAAGRLRDGNKEPSHYVLFTNLQLGLESPTTNARGDQYSVDREEIEAAIREGSPAGLHVTVLDAASLAAEVNGNAALRLTFFSGFVARTWQEKWEEEVASKGVRLIAKPVGRDKELKDLVTWLSDDAVRVISLTGPHGMGKTRLALEATRHVQLRTTVVDNVDEFERWPIASLAVAAVTRIIIIEDPGDEQATRLATRAVGEARVKLILTIPSRDKAPKLGLTDDTTVKELPLRPLEDDSAGKLLTAANPDLDNALGDWIIRSAGGIPFLILSAAHIGEELRGKVGSLKQSLAARFLKRIEKEHGPDGVAVLRVVSPLQSVMVTGEKSDLPLLLKICQEPMTTARALELLGRLTMMGVVRRRGKFVAVTPPLFAAVLAEDVFAAYPAGMRTLYDELDEVGRRKLLERVVTLDLADDTLFWEHVFAQCGNSAATILANAGLFYTLARATPERAARCLEKHIEELVRFTPDRWGENPPGELASAIRELVHNQKTCASGMRLMQSLALAGPIGEPPTSAVSHFRDAFVHWFHPFPMGYADRLMWLNRLLGSSNLAERQLGLNALVHATSIPHTLSGYSVTARKLGARPPLRFLKDIYSYLESIFQIRFRLLTGPDAEIAAMMGEGLPDAVAQLERQLPVDRAVRLLGEFLELFKEGRLAAKPADVRRTVERFINSYSELRTNTDASLVAKWDAPLAQLEVYRKEFDEGPFIVRLKISVGRAYDAEQVEVDGRTMMKFEANCRNLAREAVANPALVTPEVLAVVTRPDAYCAYAFVAPLGEFDVTQVFLPSIESVASVAEGERTLALYLAAVRARDPAFADARLDYLASNSSLPKSALLHVMNHFGSTLGNRRRVLSWVADKSVDPATLGQILGSRWLDNLPPDEVDTVLRYVLTAEKNGAALVVNALSMFLHPNKALPRELIPFAFGILSSIERMSAHPDYECSQIAIGISRTDKAEGFRLFRERMAAAGAAGRIHRDTVWNPLARFGSHTFWEFLRDTWPEETYRALPSLEGIGARDIFTAMLNLEKHREVLLKIASDETSALCFVSLTGGSQEGFFEFAYGLLDLHPASAVLKEKLTNAAIAGDIDNSFGADRYREVVARVEKVTKDPGTPTKHRDWLEAARREATTRVAEDERHFGRPEEDQGWDL